MPETTARFGLYMFAHNEADSINAAICSVLAQEGLGPVDIHVMVNGSNDATADIVAVLATQHPQVHLHDLKVGDKCNTWNVAVHDVAGDYATHFFMDGDVTISARALTNLYQALKADPHAIAAAAVPFSGRSRAAQVDMLVKNPGVAGNLYALSAEFVSRVRARGIRLPVGMVGDDSFVGVMAATDLGAFESWDKKRIAVVQGAGYLYPSVALWSWREAKMQFKRMRRYSRRRFENLLVRPFLENHGFTALPRHVGGLYAWGLDRLHLKWRGWLTLFDWLALRDIQRMGAQHSDFRP